MNDAFSETTQSDEPPPRFQFALWQLLAVSLVLGAGVVFAPFHTLFAIPFALPLLFKATWIERFIVWTIFFVLYGMFFSIGVSTRSHPHRQRRSQMLMSTIVMALEKYRDDFGEYPPNNFPTSNGSEVLYHFLCTRSARGGVHFGPYLENTSTNDSDSNGFQELKTPFNHDYVYILKPDKTLLVIDRGADGFLGGTVSPEQGFVPDGSDVNGDGASDHKDNLYSNP